MSVQDYLSAVKIGKKEYHACVNKGTYPYLPVLEDIIDENSIDREVSLGSDQIPLRLVVGTCTAGRTTAFADNFMPILDWGRGKGRVREAKSQLALTNTQVEQGMRDFYQNVEKLVLQFNMQARKVHVASLTDQRAEKRHYVARRLYIMGRNSILDLNAAISDKDSARRNHIATMRTYWSLYYMLRSMTGYDFEHNKELKEEQPVND